MIVKLGYVSIAMNLPKVTSSSNVTFKTYSSLTSHEDKLNKLKKVTLSNLNDLYKILQYNIKNEIHFYRITSSLVPLANHPNVISWPYRDIFKDDFKKIGNLIKENNMRVDTHPNQFNVINSTKEHVVKNTLNNLYIPLNLFHDMGYDLGKIILHVGSSQGGKKESIKRFITNFNTFPKNIREKILLENDDKTFTANDVLNICTKVNIPMVLDVHHYVCNNEGDNIESLLNYIFSTWDKEYFPPKIHFSSPKNGENDRRHADYINVYDFLSFIEKCKYYTKELDVMLESKKKDLAIYKLIKDIKSIKKDWKWLDKTTFITE